MSIRPATQADIPAIDALVILAVDEAWQRPSISKCRSQILACLQNGLLLVAEEDGVVCGGIAAVVDQLWYTEEYILREISLFVHPDYRRSHHAKDLIEAAKAASRTLGIPLMMSPHSTDRTSAKCRLIGRRLNKIGEFFVSE